MYYAAGIAGADPNSRCIGVAVSKHGLRPLHPRRQRAAGVPGGARSPARRRQPADQGARQARPDPGVIDPSAFTGNNGQRFLVYRTQGQPSSIRLVKLSQRGRRIQTGQTSMFLTNHEGIEENPVIIRHDDKWVMFTSVGWFGRCGYRTVLAPLSRLPRLVPRRAEAPPVDGQRPVRPRRRRRAASAATAARRSTSTRGPATAAPTRARPTGTRTGRRSATASGPCTAPT